MKISTNKIFCFTKPSNVLQQLSRVRKVSSLNQWLPSVGEEKPTPSNPWNPNESNTTGDFFSHKITAGFTLPVMSATKETGGICRLNIFWGKASWFLILETRRRGGVSQFQTRGREGFVIFWIFWLSQCRVMRNYIKWRKKYNKKSFNWFL